MKFKKRILFLVLFFLACSAANADEEAQPGVDSLLLILEEATQSDDSAGMLGISHELANYFDDKEVYDSAVIYYQRGIKLAELMKNKERLASMQNNLGNIFLAWGNYRYALDLYISALNICTEVGDSTGISKALNNIGIIYYDWGDMEKSLEYYQGSYKVDSLLGDQFGQAQTLNNIAILYDEMGEKEKALKAYYRTLEIAKAHKDHYQIAVTSSNIGGFYLEAKDFEKAQKFHMDALMEYRFAYSPIGEAETYINLGDLLKEQGLYTDALDHYKRGLDMVIPMNLNWSILNAYESMQDVYSRQGRHELAYDYLQKHRQLNDSIFNVETSQQLALLTNAYEIHQKDLEMEIQTSRMNEQNMKIKRQRIIMIGLGALMVIIAIFTVLLIRQYQLRMRAWRQLLAQHEEILKNRQELIIAKENAEESDRLKTTFLVNVSHELRTPMNGIMGFTDLLQRRSSTEEQNKLYLSYIASSSRQLLKVLNDIIDISSIETGQFKLDSDICELHNIFLNLEEYFEKEKTESGKEMLELNYIAPDDAGTHMCMGDKKRLAQIIFNLLSNAILFTKEGNIDFGYELIDGKTLKIFVNDSGIGIERSNFEMIFERFRQVDDSTTRQHGGSGLGLAICKELVNLMGGKIYLDSEIGKGSVFYVEIPYEEVVVE